MKQPTSFVVFWVTITSTGFYIYQLIKDFIESEMKGYGYYFSESALFGSIWLLFIPLTIITWKKDFFRLTNKWLMLMIPSLTVGHILSYALIVWIISGIFMNQPFVIFRNFKFGLLEYFLIISIVYFLIIFLLRIFTAKNGSGKASVSYAQNLVLTKNSRKDIIPVDGIISIHANTPYVEVITHDKKYLEKISLKELQQQLDPSIFLRVHKSAIINLLQVKSYTSRMNGDYDIILLNDNQVRMSRNFAPDFKRLVKQDITPSG